MKEKVVFGIDVGGTTVKCGLFTTEGKLLEMWEIPTRTENGGAAILPDVARTVKDKIRREDWMQPHSGARHRSARAGQYPG